MSKTLDSAAQKHDESAMLNQQSQARFAKMFATLQNKPFDLATIHSFPTHWQHIGALNIYSAKAKLSSAVVRHEYFLSYMLSYQWLEGFVEEAMSAIQSSAKSHWYHKLANAVYNNVKNRVRKFDYKITDYSAIELFTNMPSVPISFNVSSQTDRAIMEEVFEQLMEILSVWLGFPNEPDAYAKARFLYLVTCYVSYGLLYLDSTDAAFWHLRRRVVGTKYGRKFRRSIFSEFISQLKTHPIYNKDSKERQLLKEIESIYDPWYSPLARALPITWIPERMDLFYRFITFLLPLLDTPGPITNRGAFIHKVSLDRDFLLPYRNMAPTLQLAHQADPGPYSLNSVRTRGGFFSALVLRALTFSAPMVVEDGHVYFESFEDWYDFEQAATAEGKPKEYFADVSAYGTPNRFRNTSIVPELWKASSLWEERIEDLEDGQFDPIEFYQWICGKEASHHTVKFTNIGPLTAYLLTADYVHAGMVKMPTLDEMATLIHSIGRGALAGLRALGLLPRGQQAATVNDVSLALDKLVNFLSEKLTEEEKKKMDFNLILVEHALCKFVRLNVSPQDLK